MRRGLTGHPHKLQLAAWFDGEDVDRVGPHVTRCVRCRSRLTDLAQLRSWVRGQGMFAMGDPRPHASFQPRRTVTVVGALAVAIAVAVLAAPMLSGPTARMDRRRPVAANTAIPATVALAAPFDQARHAGMQLGVKLRTAGVNGPVGTIVGTGPESALAAGLASEVKATSTSFTAGSSCGPELATLTMSGVVALAVAGPPDVVAQCLAALASSGWKLPYGVYVASPDDTAQTVVAGSAVRTTIP